MSKCKYMSKLLTLIEENPLILLNGALNYGHEYESYLSQDS